MLACPLGRGFGDQTKKLSAAAGIFGDIVALFTTLLMLLDLDCPF
jgi:hypothetical protein